MAAEKTCPNCQSRLPAATALCPNCGMEQLPPGAPSAWSPPVRERSSFPALIGVLVLLVAAAGLAFALTRKPEKQKQAPPSAARPNVTETPQGAGAKAREPVNDPPAGPEGVKRAKAPAPEGPIGIFECDLFLSRWQGCQAQLEPAISQAMSQSFAQIVDMLKTTRDQDREQARNICEMISESMLTTLESLGCKQP